MSEKIYQFRDVGHIFHEMWCDNTFISFLHHFHYSSKSHLLVIFHGSLKIPFHLYFHNFILYPFFHSFILFLSSCFYINGFHFCPICINADIFAFLDLPSLFTKTPHIGFWTKLDISTSHNSWRLCMMY